VSNPGVWIKELAAPVDHDRTVRFTRSWPGAATRSTPPPPSVAAAERALFPDLRARPTGRAHL